MNARVAVRGGVYLRKKTFANRLSFREGVQAFDAHRIGRAAVYRSGQPFANRLSFREGVQAFDVFFFKQKTAYEVRVRDWSSDVCSSDLTRSGRVTMRETASRRRSIRAVALLRWPRRQALSHTKPAALMSRPAPVRAAPTASR